jgi:hypothetical protein
MKPIIILAVLSIAGITLGTGFLNNDINLWIQQFGVGSGDISTPTDHALVDFDIIQVRDQQTQTFKNLVQKCEITPDDTIGLPIGTDITVDGVTFTVTKPSEITCKITNLAGQIIAEGTVSAPVFPAGVAVPIIVLKDPNVGTSYPTVFETHDVIVVIHANTYSSGDKPPQPNTP